MKIDRSQLGAVAALTTIAVLTTITALAAAPSTPAASRGKAAVRVQNRSSLAFHHVYLRPANGLEWGPDQLGKDTVEAGENFTLSDLDCGSHDVRLVDQDGDECVVAGISLCRESPVWEVTGKELLNCPKKSATRRVNVEVANRSGWTIQHLHLRPTTDQRWGPDQVGGEAVTPGESLTLIGIACGGYDVKLMDTDGNACVLAVADLCSGYSVWKLTNAELLRCRRTGGR